MLNTSDTDTQSHRARQVLGDAQYRVALDQFFALEWRKFQKCLDVVCDRTTPSNAYLLRIASEDLKTAMAAVVENVKGSEI